jgi:hypothetical protein
MRRFGALCYGVWRSAEDGKTEAQVVSLLARVQVVDHASTTANGTEKRSDVDTKWYRADFAL